MIYRFTDADKKLARKKAREFAETAALTDEARRTDPTDPEPYYKSFLGQIAVARALKVDDSRINLIQDQGKAVNVPHGEVTIGDEPSPYKVAVSPKIALFNVSHVNKHPEWLYISVLLRGSEGKGGGMRFHSADIRGGSTGSHIQEQDYKPALRRGDGRSYADPAPEYTMEQLV